MRCHGSAATSGTPADAEIIHSHDVEVHDGLALEFLFRIQKGERAVTGFREEFHPLGGDELLERLQHVRPAFTELPAHRACHSERHLQKPVLSSIRSRSPPGVEVTLSPEEIPPSHGDIFVIGGVEIWRVPSQRIDEWIVSHDHATFEGDTHLTEIEQDFPMIEKAEDGNFLLSH